ncbi:hypothetical protein NY2A_B286R [Paramecium bursaria Chlorella virus NY2A]|uniref:Uncharacterized protein B286R n=1 Tax=Paramecium bursaria Chlorella virus NY2A TaxID=46021 RepID=A7IWG1_PBCVN|nr:hypothetical protein NY2A_B286R [Paramecium bursaria Chlorella virus NY2A]ABT14685.1 hypothetical protein NY2A_B286R [Paramecium bursaria Chlorella virus NY2A]
MISWVVYAISKNIPIVETSEGVELVVDPDEDKLVYIGYTCDFDRRIDEHYRDAHNEKYTTSQKFYNRIRNKWDEFDKTILVHSIESEQDAKDIEVKYIEKYNSFRKGLNSTPGGDGCGSGADHPCARAIRVYNNSTGEETTYDCIVECTKELGISRDNICHVLSHKTSQAKSTDGNWYQIKYIEDTTEFMMNMPTQYEKISGSNSSVARKIVAYNNTTKEETTHGSITECATELEIIEQNISKVLSKQQSQTKSIDNVWYQFKYEEDDTPFEKNMPTFDEKKIGGRNHKAKPVCAFGKLYDSTATACKCLIEVVDTKNTQFVRNWIRRKKNPDDIFYISKELYEKYKYSEIRITRSIFSSENL